MQVLTSPPSLPAYFQNHVIEISHWRRYVFTPLGKLSVYHLLPCSCNLWIFLAVASYNRMKLHAAWVASSEVLNGSDGTTGNI
jgi:hypothetical protein